VDETWIHHYTLETKQWTEAGCSAPKETRSVPSAGSGMALVFGDAEGILFIGFLEKGKTITGEYYSILLTRLLLLPVALRPFKFGLGFLYN
jgi:hypothetical protein